MNSGSIEDALRSHGESIARMQPDPQAVGAVLAEVERRTARATPRRRRFGALAIGFACLLLGAAVASAATGLLGPALDSFFGGGSLPGRELSGADVPSWLQPAPDFNAPDEVSVVASAGDEHLYAYRQSGNVCFDYGHHVGECASPAFWQRELEAHPLFVRGPVGESVVFGLVAPAIASVRVDYATGEPTEIPVTNSGFVVSLDPGRDPLRLIGLDAAGDEVASHPLSESVSGSAYGGH
jgi:hypothetical protein